MLNGWCWAAGKWEIYARLLLQRDTPSGKKKANNFPLDRVALVLFYCSVLVMTHLSRMQTIHAVEQDATTSQ